MLSFLSSKEDNFIDVMLANFLLQIRSSKLYRQVTRGKAMLP